MKSVKPTKFGTPFTPKNIPPVRTRNSIKIPNICTKRPFICLSNNSGFTLIELIVTVAVVAIAVAVALPNLRPLVLNSRMTTQTNDLVTNIQVARSEAIKRASRVVMCSSSSGAACDGSGWSSGRLIFDSSPDGTAVPNPLNNVIFFHEPLAGSIVADGTTTFPDPLIFDARGTPIQSSGRPLSQGVAMPVVFVFCDTGRSILGRQVSVNGVGQVVTAKYTC